MTAIRAVITAFVLVLIALAGTGLAWTQQHQPPAAATASAVVLGAGALAGVWALIAIWRWDPTRPSNS
jgi:hypothetical protein